MKTNKFLQFLTLAMCAVAFAFVTGCEGPMGPVGPQGPAGADGSNGTDGTDGVDGNVTCLGCHNTDVKAEKAEEFTRSAHSAGAIAVDYAGGRASCARCHSHEGFVEFARTGTVAADIANPSAWECSTCHALHTDFADLDYAFRLGDPVPLVVGGVTLDAGNNNTCINCHQSRSGAATYDKETTPKTYTRKFTGDDYDLYLSHGAVGPAGSKTENATMDTLTVVFDVPVTNVYISSTHAGPHHGPQGNLWAGLNGAGVADGAIFEGHSDGCVVCHMGPASGHSFDVTTDDYANCMECHSTSKEPFMVAFEDRLIAVGMALVDEGAVHFDQESYDAILDETDSRTAALFGSFHPMYSSLDRDIFNAWWNFTFLLEDRSKGAHNPTYTEALLSASEDALGL